MRSIAADLLVKLAALSGLEAFHTKVPQVKELPCVTIYRPESGEALQTHTGGQTQAKEMFRIEVHARTIEATETKALSLMESLRDFTGLLKAGSELTVQAIHIAGMPDSDQYSPVDGSDERVYTTGFPASLFVSE